MADADLRARADERFARALQEAGARDPRDFYRKQMAALKAANREAYQRAVSYFEERLIPAVAADDSDPLAEWLEYGRVLANLATPGRTVQIDAGGRAADYARPVPPGSLVLHLPERTGDTAIPVGLPTTLSPAQRANYDLLVRQQQGL
ncbi:hypothetical protein [Longimicrobium sp.]|uniref:hypothetical protein n=1 Tax=Longimicrobium sp. TaxID=2029185 RepID=UPI002D10D4C0|nr:hypothetical protein [Longimicrobium sp.]HSU14448.1 hypothetical protein [Longimicrobium sp.]